MIILHLFYIFLRPNEVSSSFYCPFCQCHTLSFCKLFSPSLCVAAVRSLTTGSKGHSSPLISIHLNLCIKDSPYLLIHLFTCLLFAFIRCSFPKSCFFSVLLVPGTGKWSVAIGHVNAPYLTTLWDLASGPFLH